MPGSPKQSKSFLRGTWIEFRVSSPFRRALFAFVVALVALPLGYLAARIGAAAILSASGRRAAVLRAIALDRANPRLYEQMGRIEQGSGSARFARSIVWFRKAIALQPGDAFYWQNLARTCQFAGDQDCATDSYSRALRLDPMGPRLLWLSANHELLVGSARKAASLFQRLLTIDPDYADPVFSICLRAYGDPRFIEDRILPSGRSTVLRVKLVDFFSGQGDFSLADRVWSQLASTPAHFHFRLADPYLEELISSGRIAQAVGVWRDLERLGILPDASGGGAGNLVFNPGFERKLLNAGFGWRFRNDPSSSVEFADPTSHRGSRCLRIDFAAVKDQSSEPVFQLISVSDGHTYRLTAWIRSQGISPANGPRLRLEDPRHPQCSQAQTAPVTGTTAWHPVSLTFSTCAQTKIVRLSVWCPRGDDLSSTATGHFWLDDVTLEANNRADLSPSFSGAR